MTTPSMTQEDERRDNKRRELLLFLPVFDEKTQHALGYLADISPDGLLLFSQSPIEQGKEFYLEIHVRDLREALVFDDQTDYSGDSIRFMARSRWIGIDPGLYRTGFMFINVPEESREGIQRIIRNLDKISQSFAD